MSLSGQKNKSWSIGEVMQKAADTFDIYRNLSTVRRADFLQTIASNLEAADRELLALTSSETNLPLYRLRSEMTRTCFQMRMYAALIKEGNWVNAIIDHAKPNENPPTPDLRSMQVPIGPVVVFGASNFPYAYSTAGGDTASALAAGCSVVVKQHPAHSETSIKIFELIRDAAVKTGMPNDVVQHVPDAGFETGKALVQHPATAAVGFTGSYSGGMALYAYSQSRKFPIPVFAEMGSVNPVLLLPNALEKDASVIASKYAASITLGMGQYCTNPGIIFGVKGQGFEQFTQHLLALLNNFEPDAMLHAGIEKLYLEKTCRVLKEKEVEIIAGSQNASKPNVCLTRVSAEAFLKNPLLHEEIFGPFSLLVVCESVEQMMACRKVLHGQLTTSIMAARKDFEDYGAYLDAVGLQSGRVVYNGVPTGVAVCNAMVHGGPLPASTDGRYTAVGPKAIYRWTRLVCWQNAPDILLPDALKEANPLQIWRMVDGVLSKA